MQHVVIIVAGGSGTRLGGSIPKQFLKINGKPVIFHTIEKFLAFDSNCHFIIALQDTYQTLFKEEATKHLPNLSYQISLAGKERFHTVKNALDLVPDDCIVGIHDAVRPLVSLQTIKNCFEGLDETHENSKGVIPVIPLVNSIRQVDLYSSKALNRADYRIVQTPQYFISHQIKKAYQVAFSYKFTDDASVFEDQIGPIELVNGNPENIKITNKIDLNLVEVLI